MYLSCEGNMRAVRFAQDVLGKQIAMALNDFRIWAAFEPMEEPKDVDSV